MPHDASIATELKITVGESIVATLAATVSALVLEVPVWAMFVGWISYFTRGVNPRQGMVNLACVLVGHNEITTDGAIRNAECSLRCSVDYNPDPTDIIATSDGHAARGAV
jgi:hypothetical protein